MPQPHIPAGFRPLSEQHMAALAGATPKQIAGHLALACMLGDVETCTYITARHFDKLPMEVQIELRTSGLKSISDITQDMIEGKVPDSEAAMKELHTQTDTAIEKAQTPAVPGTDTVH